MKTLLITLCLVSLFTFKSSAQDLVMREFAKDYAGKFVAVWDTVTTVRIINPEYAILTIDKGNPHDQLVISLKCKHAAKMASYLNGKYISVKGVIRVADLGTEMTVTKIANIDEFNHSSYDAITEKDPAKK